MANIFFKRLGSNKKVLVLTILFLFAIVFSIVHLSYALFHVDQEKSGAFTIVVGDLHYEYHATGLDQNNQITVPAGSAYMVPFTISNNSNVPIDYKILYQLVGQTSIPSGFKIGTIGNTQQGNVSSYPSNTTKTFDIIVMNDTDRTVTIQFDFVAGLVGAPIDIGNKEVINKAIYYNTNILNVYNYDASSCITGEETTCVEIDPPETYAPGTIVKYKVNASEVKYFHVISDNEDGTLTMQQSESTICSTAWCSGCDGNNKGPLTALQALEGATSNWTNVNDQNYTMGVTLFMGNSFTGCDFDSQTKEPICTANTYVLGNRTAKARMITAQEAGGLGCTLFLKSCPNWMINRSGNGGSDDDYWTMSADSGNKYDVIYIATYSMATIYPGRPDFCARAVVVIDK